MTTPALLSTITCFSTVEPALVTVPFEGRKVLLLSTALGVLAMALAACSRWRNPPRRSARPTSPFIVIISTENIVLRAKVGCASPVSITAPMVMISMLATLTVKIRVPEGSPSRSASLSAWPTIRSAPVTVAANSHKTTRLTIGARRVERS